jgi:hypothetical protein
MCAAGFYLHHRQWRRKGDRMTTPSRVTAEEVPQTIRDRVFEFLSRSGRGEVTVQDSVAFFEAVQDDLTPVAYCWLVKRLAQLFNGCDNVTAIDPRGHAQQALIRWLQEEWNTTWMEKKADPATSEILRRYLNVQRYELGGPESPLLEQMLADQVVLSSVEVHGLTHRVVGAEKQFAFDEAEHFDRRRDRAARRMHESIKLLHLIRTKAGPAMQVNVQQNVTVSTEKTGERTA